MWSFGPYGGMDLGAVELTFVLHTSHKAKVSVKSKCVKQGCWKREWKAQFSKSFQERE
jgi:hypothetical protein